MVTYGYGDAHPYSVEWDGTSPTDRPSLSNQFVQAEGALQHSLVPTYRLHDTTGDDLGVLEHPARNVGRATS